MSRNTIAAAVLLVGSFAPSVASSQNADQDAVRRVVQLYFDGITRHDSTALLQAFAPEARLMFVRRDGSLFVTPLTEWRAFARRPTSPDGKRNTIVSIDITGSAAVAKTDLEWPGVHYVDYLSLLKVGGEWRIVHKTWWQEAR